MFWWVQFLISFPYMNDYFAIVGVRHCVNKRWRGQGKEGEESCKKRNYSQERSFQIFNLSLSFVSLATAIPPVLCLSFSLISVLRGTRS